MNLIIEKLLKLHIKNKIVFVNNLFVIFELIKNTFLI